MKKQTQLSEKNSRIWEIDALRGFLILAVLINHLNMAVHEYCIDGRYLIDSAAWARASDPLGIWYTIMEDGTVQAAKWVIILRKVCTVPARNTFLLISGISCMLSRDNLVRGFKILMAGFVVSLLTYVMQGPNDFVRFGVLHCYGCCLLLYDTLLKKQSNRVLLVIAALSLLFGYVLDYFEPYTNISLLYPFGVRQDGVINRDYSPIFPALGWFLLGVVFGRRFYHEKRSIVSKWWDGRGTGWLQFMGKHSGVFYMGHMFIYSAIFILIGYIFNLL